MSSPELSDDGDAELSRVEEPDARLNSTAVPLRLFLRLLTPVDSEARLTVGEAETAEYGSTETVNGIHCTMVDPANVFMVTATLPAESGAFGGFQASGQTLGVNLERLQSTLEFGRMAGSGVDDDGDPVELRYDDGHRRLETVVTRPNQRLQRVTSQSLLDPDSIRQEPDIPSLKLGHRGHPESTRALKDAVAELDHHGTPVTVRSDPDKDAYWRVESDGDREIINSDFVRFSGGHESDGGGAAESSMFSPEYLRKITRALHRARVDKVTVHWGDSFPSVWAFQDQDYGIRGMFMVAPRVNEEDTGPK
jgi:hypothetical protein